MARTLTKKRDKACKVASLPDGSHTNHANEQHAHLCSEVICRLQLSAKGLIHQCCCRAAAAAAGAAACFCFLSLTHYLGTTGIHSTTPHEIS